MAEQPEEPLDPRIYWLVIAVAVVFVIALYVFTETYNIPLNTRVVR